MSKKIIIVGAGVIGAACALTLQRGGHDVILVDRNISGTRTSFGNAGAIVNGSCVPTAMPGIMSEAMAMIFNPLSPISIRPTYIHKILPWLMRFIWQSRQSAAYKNANHLQALTQDAVAHWQQFTKNTDLNGLFRNTGWLKVYESDKAFNNSKKSMDIHDQVGSPYEILTANQIRDLEPNLAPIYKHGFYQKDSMSITNPERLILSMLELFVKNGGRYQQFSVDEICAHENSVVLKGSDMSLKADNVVIATGAWSKHLAKQLGDSIPLDTERGYHLMFPESSKDLLKRPVVNSENSFVLSPMKTGMRMACQIEFAGLKAEPNYNRVRSLVPLAKRMLPKIDSHEESIWMGCRPSLPDSLPVIGFSKQSNKVLYAFGHQHLGMTLAATTSYLISDLIDNKLPNISLEPYRPNRF